MDVLELFSIPPPPPTQQLEDVHAPFVFKFFLFVLIASIITFSKKNFFGKRNVTLDPRHGTVALDMEPSTLDKKIDSAPQTQPMYSRPVPSYKIGSCGGGQTLDQIFFLGEGVSTEAGAHQLKEK